MKMRVMQNNIFIDTFKTLGSNAVPMAYSEVYSALETKTVDGQENPFANIENSKFYEVQKYLTLTKHAYSPLVVLLSKKTWDAMSPPEQAALKECAALGRDEERRVNREQAVSSVTNLKAKGMLVNEISPAEMQRIRDRTKPVYEQHGKAIGDEAHEPGLRRAEADPRQLTRAPPVTSDLAAPLPHAAALPAWGFSQANHAGRWLARVTRWIEILSGAVLAVDVVVVFLSVIWRYVLHDPVDWAEEIARALMLVLVFFGAATVLARSRHVGVDIFRHLFPATWQRR